ncbi:Ger(x)C family spore germination protein [Sporosarcina saromensis]|uniref:Ger(X)C family spore germination protein n=1 Tax=Sporosarcina saromensis TaxID=359365 RepID=A0ABU4GBR5_9BACL|nr:Ger(x)C family spore germination protein [Sporosarcina saromensis]MDW0114439.1 Ger(x)C family spore germination protein [Sporosarcina saromensis]
MKRKILFLLLVVMTFLSGCWDSNEPERMLYINGIGVDFKDGKYELYAQIIDFTNIAKTEQPSSDQPQMEVGHATGNTVDEAIFNLYHSIDQKVFWGHMSHLVVSEEVMKNVELNPIIDLFIRYRETRYQIWVYTTKDPVDEILLVRPVINRAITLSKLGDPENSYKQESLIDPISIRQLIIDMNEPPHEVKLPLIRIDENWQSIKESIKAPVIAGVGVATPNGFKGFIEGDNARGIQWMSNETARGQITFKTDDDHGITVNVEKVKVDIQPVVRKEEVLFDVNVELEATISVIEGAITVDEIRTGVIDKVKKEIKTTYEEALKKDIDVYRLSERVYRKDLKAWDRSHKDGKLDLHEDSIRKLDVKLARLDATRKSFKETIEQ